MEKSKSDLKKIKEKVINNDLEIKEISSELNIDKDEENFGISYEITIG